MGVLTENAFSQTPARKGRASNGL